MNQDEVKAKLVSLGAPEKDFDVIFSGKKSMRVNGLYRPDTKEIIIHNQNFANDNLLIFTAIHEYAHHITCERKLAKGRSAHPAVFWSIFHSLIKIAVQKGIYTDSFTVDPILKEADAKIEAVVKMQVEAQRKLGSALLEMQTLCQERGARFEDYLDRHVRLPKETAKAAVTAQMELFELEGVSPQVVELVASIEEGEGRDEAVSRIEGGESIAQVRAAVKQGKRVDPLERPETKDETPEDTLDRLMTERKKLHAKLQDITLELQSLDATIAGLRESLPHLDFDEVVDEEEDDEDESGEVADGTR